VIFRLNIFLCCFLAFGSVFGQDPKKSTPEERQQWADKLHKLEANPLDDQAMHEAALAANRLTVVDDVTISPCALFAEFPQKWNKAQPILIYLLALSAYQVETGKNDAAGSNLYATRSVLKAYASAIAKDPKLRDKKFDSLAKMDADGKLSELAKKDHCE
jgi:hypothetical protein